jgi:hypothetical protein
MNTSQKINRVTPWPLKVNGQQVYESTNKIGRTISGTGVSGIDLWQYRHLPFKLSQLKMGIKSMVASTCLQ